MALAVCAVSALPQGGRFVITPVEDETTTTTTHKPPIPILKSISKVNDDGSYTFGYESGKFQIIYLLCYAINMYLHAILGDGSFRIEKKELNGHIKGTNNNRCGRNAEI